MRGILSIIIALAFGASLNSQGLSHQVLLPCASVLYSNGIHFSQTIGESATELISSGAFDLTQGFQQPSMKFLPGTVPPGNGVNAFPNPAKDYMRVELFGDAARSFRIIITNISGTQVYSTDIDFSEKYWYLHEIPVSSFSPGLYFIHVQSKDGSFRRSFKIEKM